ncbi:MAG: ABC transporter ATP-binding protein [Clostridiales bacterium]|jgi:oligopeptide/dipeptide ABC transporter ATP-binding protein|nr:ABC transporter ATP-binding protein [Clostridiales bacterium]
MEPLLKVDNLKTEFRTLRGIVTAVDGVSFEVRAGEMFGLVGESGCGKSVTSQSIMRLYDEKKLARHSGLALLDGENLLAASQKRMRQIRGRDVSMIFQDALSALNPVFTIGWQIKEVLRIHQKLGNKESREKAVDMLRLTGIPSPETRVDSYPHELSGGMRQRAMIAMALVCKPKLLIADEPTTALDVTIQAQIMEMIADLKSSLNMGVVLITHDLGVVAQTCSRVVVMYLGQIVEEGDASDIFYHPLHPYTKGLLESSPSIRTKRGAPLHVIQGSVPPLDKAGSGCRFADRCPYADKLCSSVPPMLVNAGATQKVRCRKLGSIESGV